MSDSKQGLSEQDALSINTIRCLAADMVQAANSGHPGMPMGMAPIAHVLWRKFLRSSPSNPKWYNRDRFVLSNGHGCALLYIMLHLTGNEVTLDDLKGFRKLGSRTPGHPENLDTPGVEVTTGPLGQGIANAVGLAMAESYMATNFNKPGFELFNNHTFVFLGDGCLQEGISHEACSLAGHLGLGNLIVMYDDNHITIDGDTGLSFSEDIPKRFESYGWHTQVVGDGETNLDNIEKAISNAIAVKDKPSIICIRTIIGFGSSKQGTEHVHGAPLGDDEIAKVKTKFGFDPSKKFYVPDAVVEEYGQVKARGAAAESDWNALFESYKAKYPAEAAELVRRFNREPPKDWEKALPAWKPSDKADATRNTSNVVLNAMANVFPELVGGSADLTGSNKTALKGAKDFEKNNHGGRYLRFGVREHAMVAIANGFYVYGCFIPFTATFLNFIEYCFPAVRLAALSHIQQILIMTHDSIGLGEDGPTHQPVEAVNLCRATPNTLLLRPADGNEVAGSYLAALKFVSGPSVICASRHNLPNLPNTSAENVLKGAYVIVDPDEGKTKPDLILVGTGSETHLCVAAASKIGSKVRVVSMPSWELFDAQSVEYRRSVFIPGVPVVSVEAAALQGWQKYAHAHIGMTTFGKSGSVEDVFEYFGFTADKIAETVKQRIDTLKKQCEELGLPFAASPLPTHFHVKY